MSILKREPVRLFTFVGALIPIVASLLAAFGAIRWTAADSTTVTAAYGAFLIALGEFTRGQVTPVAAPAIVVPLDTAPVPVVEPSPVVAP